MHNIPSLPDRGIAANHLGTTSTLQQAETQDNASQEGAVAMALKQL